VSGQAGLGFGGLLRRLRDEAGLTQDELAEAARVSQRAISDLERGINRTARKDTALLLAGALGLDGQAAGLFVAAARDRLPAGEVLAALQARPTRAFAAAATRALPRDTASFTGRQRELVQLAKAASALDGVVNIHAIGGMAGVGKTAFAVHAAHRLADRFPAGQIFLPLHGHTPGQRPVEPADALASLLLTTGVPPARIPPGLEARQALWRDRLALEKLLLVLDDAVSSEQVRPLLPGHGMVLVTSRRHLSALEDATAISLDTLPPPEAAALLVRLAGRAGLSPDDPAVGEITRLCGNLPLAIGMVARQLHHHPAWSVAGRAAELALARDRLELMATENLSVAAAFDLSYEDLTADQQRLFRRLALHPGADIDGYAAAALDGTDLSAARRGLEALYDHYLITERARGRYRMHDLIREHARALADHLDPDGDRHRASVRLLDYYQHAAALANGLIARQADPGTARTRRTIAFEVPDLTRREDALAWARAERASLLACLDHATATGQHTRVIALTAALAGLLRHDGPWAEAINRHEAASRAAQHLDDRLAQSAALDSLGILRRLTGDYPGAAQALQEALGISRDLGDRPGQAAALNNLGILRRLTGDYPGAMRDLEEALGVSLGLGDQLSRALALRTLGDVRRLTGDNQGAIRDVEEALGIYRQLGNRDGESEALNLAGTLHRARGDVREARFCHQQALDLARQIGNPWNEAHALAGLGRCALVDGHSATAEDWLHQALEIFRRIGPTETAGVSAELQTLSKARPTAQGS
jgi:tetratricopeptide (TPR) repeat protein/transcriptional regulator with XRE-family HTH domain